MIELRSVTKKYADKTVFEDMSLKFESGKCTALMGESGIGKTTLLRIIAGLEQPDAGQVLLPENARLTCVFQENRLFNERSVISNILCVAPDKKRAEYFLERCGLRDCKDKKTGTLSGGMKRRLAIARALAYAGDIYFLDEPLRELDEETAKAMEKLIKEELTGKTAILITHDRDQAKNLADNIFEFAGSPMKLINGK